MKYESDGNFKHNRIDSYFIHQHSSFLSSLFKRGWKRWALVLLAGAVIIFLGVIFMSFWAQRPDHLGVKHGKLAACPSTPNCVSTQAEDVQHRMEPWPFTGSASTAMQRLKQMFLQQPRVKIVAETDTYLHVEATSLVFRFVDDVEFLIDESAQRIHFRSASRVGRSDLGVNRSRMEQWRTAWETAN